MSIFGSILDGIFGRAQVRPSAEQPGATQAKPLANPQFQPPASGGQQAGQQGRQQGGEMASANIPFAPSPAPKQPVDVAAVLDKLTGGKKEKLDWRHSIVDLMKVLDLDSSLSARKELAKELQYSGDTKDSAAMNIWLHKQVMIKLAANGGKVPEDLKH